VERVQEFEAGLLEHMRTRHSDVGETIRRSGKLEEETESKLRSAVEDFKSSFADRVGTVETVAAEEGVPEASGSPAAEGSETGSASSSGQGE
jgi:F-type H+/Na+-transporting ATPase subunit alpha